MAKSEKKLSKNENSTNFDTIKTGQKFLTFDARIVFNHVWLAFIQVPILQHFDLEYHILIGTNVLGYVIDKVLSQLTFRTNPDGVVTKTDMSKWHLVVFFSKKRILIETWYKTHNGKLSVIIKVFKTLRHYLKSYKHKMLVLTNYNNLCHFIDTKNLSSK